MGATNSNPSNEYNYPNPISDVQDRSRALGNIRHPSNVYNYPNRISNIQDRSRALGNTPDLSERQVTSSSIAESKQKIQLKSLKELSNDFKRLLDPESSCSTDVTLKCGGVSIRAHKIILSVRSPVFAAMFGNPMKESFKNEVNITDINVSTLRALLFFMYTGKTSNLTASSSEDLLFAADKYQVQDLKTVCCYFLKETVSLQNVWRVLVLGDMHSEDLKSFAVDYICNKCGEFSVLENTQEWKGLRKERSDLAMELLESLVKYRDKKLKR
ncbi:Speckle-type POZ protein-like B [Araneus ventricosus]|uniref:Speckle-type POZ protein-like B n=1 Tax=Araneus ventricosus TaxID=182803 RepID=A0A4Y2IE27_ARAVE|nr:Speckle-type POZ protein-like B [Araneus ventricosus]